MKTKLCKKCAPPQEKPLDQFYNSAKSPDGKGYYCKSCSNAANQKRMKLLFDEDRQFKQGNGIRRATSR